jgi:hypothetical protein
MINLQYVIRIWQKILNKAANDSQDKGPFKYYVSKEVGGWGSQLLTFADKVRGWGWTNADVSKK